MGCPSRQPGHTSRASARHSARSDTRGPALATRGAKGRAARAGCDQDRGRTARRARNRRRPASHAAGGHHVRPRVRGAGRSPDPAGPVYYQDDGPGAAPDAPRSRRFGIRTTTLQVGASIQDEVRDLVFDGRWLIERVPAEKQFIKRRIVADGQKFDPLRLGEGPFPLPIGQKRADILRKYVAKLLPAEQDVTANGETETDTERLKKFVAGSYQLQLTPRPELLESEELRDIRLWYRPSTPEPGAPATLLPRMARTVNRVQDVMLVQLVNVRLNQPVDATVLDTTPPTGDDWKIQED